MAWSPQIPWVPLTQADMPQGAASQALFFNSIGTWFNNLASGITAAVSGVAPVPVPSAASTPGSYAVTFPSGRFASGASIYVFTQVVTANPQTYQSGYFGASNTGVTIYAAKTTTGAATVNVAWLAVVTP